MSVGKTTYGSFSAQIESVACTPVSDLMRQENSPQVGSATLDLITRAGYELRDVSIRAGEQTFEVSNEIGTPNTQRNTRAEATRLVALQCPKSREQRCASCVLDLLNTNDGRIVSAALRNAAYKTPDPNNPSNY